MKTSETTLPQLNWLVAKLEGFKYIHIFHGDRVQIMVSNKKNASYDFNPAENWARGGPIIEREGIIISPSKQGGWIAMSPSVLTERQIQCGFTPLIAAMRYFVASKLGDNVDIPEELK